MAEVHGALASADQTPRAALLAGRYELLQEIGRGGMGVVYRARDRRLDRDVAVKVLHDGPEAGSHDSRRRLLDESKVMARFRHPNVVTIHDVLLESERAYVVMEFVRGQTLRAWLSQADRAPQDIFAIFESIGEGLAAAHRQGIVHRDFKPDNVLIDDEGRPSITDFGLAQRAAPDEESLDDASVPSPARPLSPGGTLAYAPPEQLRPDAPVDVRGDVFAFCVSLWEALSAARPFPERSTRGRLAAIEEGRVIEPPPGTIARRVQVVLRRGLSPRPEERPRSVSLLLRQLRRARSQRKLPAFVGLGVLSMAAAGVWWAQSDRAAGSVAPCAASALVGDDIEIEIDLEAFDASLQHRLASVGTLVAADALAEASRLRTALVLTAEQTCHDQAEGSLSPHRARAQAHCLRTIGVHLHAVVTGSMEVPDAVAILPELPAPELCRAWSAELEPASSAGRIRNDEELALADALARVTIRSQFDEDQEGVHAVMGRLLARAEHGDDPWLLAKATYMAAKVDPDEERSRTMLLHASQLFAQAGDPAGQLETLEVAILIGFGDDGIHPDTEELLGRAHALHQRLEDPNAIPRLALWLDMADMMLILYRGDHARARALARRVRRFSPKVSPATTYMLADLLIIFDEFAGDYDALVRSSETLIDWLEGRGVFARAQLVDAQFSLAYSLLGMGRLKEAERAWDRAIEVRESMQLDGPLSAEPLLLRARLDAMSDRLLEGLARLESLRARLPMESAEGRDVRALQAELLLRMGDRDQALALAGLLEEGLRRWELDLGAAQPSVGRPTGLEVVTAIAEVYRRCGKLDQARALLQHQARWNMEHYPHAFQSLHAALVQAWIDSDRGELDTAQAGFEALEGTIPSAYEAAWATVGRIVTTTRAGRPPGPHVDAMIRAREILGEAPRYYRDELAMIDTWLDATGPG